MIDLNATNFWVEIRYGKHETQFPEIDQFLMRLHRARYVHILVTVKLAGAENEEHTHEAEAEDADKRSYFSLKVRLFLKGQIDFLAKLVQSFEVF